MKNERNRLIREAGLDGAEGGTRWRDRVARWMEMERKRDSVVIRLPVSVYTTDFGRIVMR